MVTISSAENALKNLYLGVVADQLNTGINPLFAKIKQTTSDVWGKNIVKLVPYGLNGGVGAGSETGTVEMTLLYESLKYAVIVASTLPMMIFYPFMQRYFVKGVMIGSVKG